MTINHCKWAVAYKIDGSFYDDNQERTSIVAVFRYSYQAEDFIEKCLQPENKDRFFIENINLL